MANFLYINMNDPISILYNLGFGVSEETAHQMIPSRFLKPSNVRGNDISNMIENECDNFNDVPSVYLGNFEQVGESSMVDKEKRKRLTSIASLEGEMKNSLSKDEENENHLNSVNTIDAGRSTKIPTDIDDSIPNEEDGKEKVTVEWCDPVEIDLKIEVPMQQSVDRDVAGEVNIENDFFGLFYPLQFSFRNIRNTILKLGSKDQKRPMGSKCLNNDILRELQRHSSSISRIVETETSRKYTSTPNHSETSTLHYDEYMIEYHSPLKSTSEVQYAKRSKSTFKLGRSQDWLMKLKLITATTEMHISVNKILNFVNL